MMQAKPAHSRFNAVKVTHLLVALAALSLLGVYGYHLFTLYRDAQRHQPQLQAKRLIRDLRRYQQQMQGFPRTFSEINHLIWHTKPTPDYGQAGTQVRTKNYYYAYHRIAADKCVLWALPVGPRRELASSYFFVIAPQWLKVWQGPALNDVRIGQLPLVPTPNELVLLDLKEIASRAQTLTRGNPK